MSENTFVPVSRRSRSEIEEVLRSGKASDIAAALISAAYWDPEWRWAQDQLLHYSDNADRDIQWAVATGLGFLAAFHGELDLELVLPTLKKMCGGASNDAVEEALADIERFVVQRRAGEDVDLAERLSD